MLWLWGSSGNYEFMTIMAIYTSFISPRVDNRLRMGGMCARGIDLWLLLGNKLGLLSGQSRMQLSV